MCILQEGGKVQPGSGKGIMIGVQEYCAFILQEKRIVQHGVVEE